MINYIKRRIAEEKENMAKATKEENWELVDHSEGVKEAFEEMLPVAQLQARKRNKYILHLKDKMKLLESKVTGLRANIYKGQGVNNAVRKNY